MTNQNVYINGVEYKGVEVASLSITSTLAQHPVEEVEITEHIALQPAIFRLDMNLFDEWKGSGETAELVETRLEKFNRLKNLWLTKTPFQFVCDLGVFDDMIVSSFRPDITRRSKTSFPASLVLRQIITVELLPIKVQVITDEDGTIIGVIPNGSTLTEVTLTTPESIAEDENKSLLEKLWSWIGG